MATNKALSEAILELNPGATVAGLNNAQLTSLLSETKAAPVAAGDEETTPTREEADAASVEADDAAAPSTDAEAAWEKEVVAEVTPARAPGPYVAAGRSIITRRGSRAGGTPIDPEKDGISDEDGTRLVASGHIEVQD